MPADNMKDAIAEAAKKLLIDRNVKKLTVKDIVEECSITRQTFYYHFADIPALFSWVLERETERLVGEAKDTGDPEKTLAHLFLVMADASRYMKKSMQSNYGDELERLVIEYTHRFFERVIDAEGLYKDRTRYEVRLIVRYHSSALLGLIREWTDEDTENVDQIAHLVYLLVTEGIPPTKQS